MQLLPGGGRQRAELGVGQRRLAGAVAPELSGRRVRSHAALLAGEGALHHQSHSPAAARAISRSMRGPTVGARCVLRERDLLADDRRQVGVEREHELLEVLPRSVSLDA